MLKFNSVQLILSTLFATLIVCGALQTAHAGATTAGGSNMILVKKIWTLDDNDLLLTNIQASMLSGKQNLLNNLSPKQADSIKKLLANNFARIKQAMLQYMAQNGRATQLEQYDTWLQTTTGKKVVKMHLFAQMMFTDPEASIPVNPPAISSARTKLQTRFIRILFSNYNAVQDAVMDELMAVQNQTRQPELRWTDTQLKEQTRLATVNLSGISSQVLPYVFDRLFKNLSLEEVTVVINFLNSATGHYYNDLLVDAFNHATQSTRPQTLLAISELFDSQTAILSQYSKVTLTDAKQRELMAMLIKQYGKPTIIRAMIDARNGQITIMTPGGGTKEVYGRPNHNLVSLDTLMTDLSKSGMDIRGFYKVLLYHLRTGQ